MITVYLKELEKREEIEWFYKIPKWAQNFLWKILKKLNWIIIKKMEENEKLYLIPNIEGKKVCAKIKRKLENEASKTQKVQIVFSKRIKKYQDEFTKYKIINGKKQFLYLVESILEKVLQESPLAMQEIFLVTKQYNEQSIWLVKQLAPKIKNMNIITKELKKYEALEEMMKDKAITICIANNKRKSLKKAKIIINMDLTKEELNQYSIYRNALIINLNQEKITNLKGFDGIMVQDIEVEERNSKKEWIKKYNLQNSFRQLELLESNGKNEQNLEKEKVLKLYGNNGEISQKELLNWQNILTNHKN